MCILLLTDLLIPTKITGGTYNALVSTDYAVMYLELVELWTSQINALAKFKTV